jgi:DNA-binding MarR family transcriptional regulator
MKNVSNLKETITYLSDLFEKVLEEVLDLSDFSDLTQQQFHYMQVIIKMKNPTLTELSRELNLTKPTVTVLVDKLAEKGYVTRIKSDEDRRVMYLHIDRKGIRFNNMLENAHEIMAEKIISGLSRREAAILNELLSKIVNNSFKQ